MTADGVATDGTLLGGRVAYRQPACGYRTGIEPVLLAASVAAVPGEHVIEGGTGAGAGLLCLCARLPGVSVHGIELDGGLAALAEENIAANGFAQASVAAGCVLDLPATPCADHAFANPPWHDAAGTASPTPRREAAKRATPGLLAGWSRGLAGSLRPGGSLTLLVPASSTAEALAGLVAAGCGSPTLFPLWPRAGREARLALVRGVRGARGPGRILAGLTLHDEKGFTAEARAILWDGASLPWR